MARNDTCDEEFVALIRGATTLDFGTVLEQQQQRNFRPQFEGVGGGGSERLEPSRGTEET